jgi:hypothetical protein
MKSKLIGALAAAGYALALSVGAPAGGNAATFTAAQNSDECSSPCNIIAGNTVTVTDVSTDTINVTARMPASWSFITTGAGDASFAFSSSLSNLSLAIGLGTTNASTWTTVGPVATLQEDGLVFPTSAYGADANRSPSLGPGNNILVLTISATGLTAATFVADLLAATNGANTTNAFFAADVLNNNNGATGIIDFGVPVAVPLPAALPLFATGLGALGLLGWRRKKAAA